MESGVCGTVGRVINTHPRDELGSTSRLHHTQASLDVGLILLASSRGQPQWLVVVDIARHAGLGRGSPWCVRSRHIRTRHRGFHDRALWAMYARGHPWHKWMGPP